LKKSKVQTIVVRLMPYINSVCNLLFMTFSILLLSNCTGLMSLQKGEKMLTEYKVNIESEAEVDQSEIKEQANQVIEPQPNQVFLGIFRPGPAIYHFAGKPKKEKGFKHWLKNTIGTAPVTLGKIDIEKTELLIKNRLQNIGFFDVTVNSEVVEKKKKASITYLVKVKKRYKLRDINYPKSNHLLDSQIVSAKNASLLDSAQFYSLEDLRNERNRISDYLKNRGYFFFDKNFMLFQADTSVGNHQFDLYLKLKENTPDKAKVPYTLNKVRVLFNEAELLGKAGDTISFNKKLFIAEEHLFRPSALDRYIFLKDGNEFSYSDYLETLNKLIDLNVFRFVNVRFDLEDSLSDQLRTEISLVSLPKKNLRASFGPVSRSNNFVGSELQGSFRNRNVFRGAEELSIDLNAGFETQFGNAQSQNINSIALGAKVSLNFPHFITPFKINRYSRKYIPRTSIEIGYDFQKRTSFYEFNSFRLSYAYRWKETSTRWHDLELASIEYTTFGNTSPSFDELIANNNLLAQSFQNQFILSTEYNFFYDNQIKNNRNRIYWNPSIDIAGNLVSVLQNVFGNSNENTSDTQEILGIPYAQYFKLNSDLRYYHSFSKRMVLATRLLTGAGFPYGNSDALPYKKQFFTGGTNSLRAFPARSVGPGNYRPAEDNANLLFFDQTGDIRLEANAEFRFDIYGYLKGALFIDAGNVWTVNEDIDRPGAKFEVDEFYQQLAIGTGFGIRMDASFFVLRADWGIPLRNPAFIADPWVINNFGSSEWRRDNIILNIGIGYPF